MEARIAQFGCRLPGTPAPKTQALPQAEPPAGLPGRVNDCKAENGKKGPAQASIQERMEKAIAGFHPDRRFTESCLIRLKFKDRILSGEEKILVLDIVKCYNPQFRQLTLTNYICLLANLESKEMNLNAMLANIRNGAAVPAVSAFMRTEDADLRQMIGRKRTSSENFDDKDY